MGVRRKTPRRRLRKKRFGLAALLAIAVLAFSFGAFIAAVWPHLFGVGGKIWSAENVQEATIKIAAVRSDGLGVICDLTVETSPGTGRVLVDTHPLVGFDFQYADRTAVKVASRITGYALDDDGEGLKGANVLFAVCTPTGETVEIQAIDGPSAGAAATIAAIAAIENRAVRDNVIMTGTISEDGTIGPVGGVFEKVKAANEVGAMLFLVPKGQSVLTMYQQVVQQIDSFQFVTYVPVSVDLNDYAENVGWNLQIQEVSKIEDAVQLMLE